jgi:hypothetical protein
MSEMMSQIKGIPKEYKIFFFIIALKSILKGMPIENFRKNIELLSKFENQKKFKHIHEKLTNKTIITPDELEFLVEYERKKQWDKF